MERCSRGLRTDSQEPTFSVRWRESPAAELKVEHSIIERPFIERRRREVREAATRIMISTGYHGMSMQAVADEAQMSAGLIYSYFGSKEELLQSVIVDILDERREGALLAYRETQTLPESGRHEIIRLELTCWRSMRPLLTASRSSSGDRAGARLIEVSSWAV